MLNERISTHRAPVWRDRSDFILRARIGAEENRFEQLWGKKIESNVFELCCIPFFLYGVALGDRVSTTAEYIVDGVVHRSGRRTLRAWFGDTENPPREEVAEEMVRLKSLIEWSSRNLLAIDAKDAAHADLLVARLSLREKLGELIFEDAG